MTARWCLLCIVHLACLHKCLIWSLQCRQIPTALAIKPREDLRVVLLCVACGTYSKGRCWHADMTTMSAVAIVLSPLHPHAARSSSCIPSCSGRPDRHVRRKHPELQLIDLQSYVVNGVDCTTLKRPCIFCCKIQVVVIHVFMVWATKVQFSNDIVY